MAIEEQDRNLHPGTVKFYKREKGWGAISSDVLPPGKDASVGFPDIDMPGFRFLEDGQSVKFRYVRAQQDSFDYQATYVLPL